MALYWQEKSTLLTNENERNDNPNEDCKGRWRTQDENIRWVTTKQTMGLIFIKQNSQLMNWSSPTEEICQVHGQNRPV